MRGDMSSSRCFENRLIVQKIIDSCVSMKNIHFRLVNRTFNQEILHKIRKTHKKIDIDLDEECLAVNHFVLKLDMVEKFFRFLNVSVGVRVEELKVVNFNEMYLGIDWSFFQKSRLHKYIMQVLLKNQQLKVFTGVDEICELGCADCEKHVLGCREYGPLQHEILNISIENHKRHFDKLIVHEKLLCNIANDCVQGDSRVWAMKKLRSIVTPNISCDHLVLQIYDDPAYCSYAVIDHKFLTQVFPREVLEEMIKVWNVKSVGITISIQAKPIDSSTWRRKNIFTEFQFEDPYESTLESSGFILDYLKVDLEESSFSNDCVFEGDEGFISNIRRVFPARQYFFNNHRTCEETLNYKECHKVGNIELNQMIQAVVSDRSPSTSFTFRYWTLITEETVKFVIPESFSIDHREFTCSVSPSTIHDTFECWSRSTPSDDLRYSIPRIAKTFQIREEKMGIVMNLEIYVEKEQVKKMLGKDKEAVEKGFLKHYLNDI